MSLVDTSTASDFSILTTIQMTKTDAAELFGINRGTLVQWVNGRKPMTRVLYTQALRICSALTAAYRKGTYNLPVKGVKKREKMQIYRNIIKAELQG